MLSMLLSHFLQEEYTHPLMLVQFEILDKLSYLTAA